MLVSKNQNRSSAMKKLWEDPEYAKKQSDSHIGKTSGMKGKHKSREAVEKTRQSNLGSKRTPEQKKNQKIGIEKAKEEGRSSGRKGRIPWNKGLVGVQVGWNKGLTKETSEGLAMVSEKLTGITRSEETRDKVAVANFGKVLTEEHKQSIRVGVLNSWENKTEEERNTWVANIRKANQCRPNGSETRLFSAIENLYPHDWKYVGGGDVVIGGRIPDFINVNGQKKIIELFGDYWHRGENPQDRIDIFKPYGYETLVIWEHELQDIEKVKLKIKEFNDMEV